MGSRKARKENALLKSAYLDDPEYRAILIKRIVQEDKDMMLVVDELAKLFQEEDGQ